MNLLDDHEERCDGASFVRRNKSTDIQVQLGLSLVLGVSAFVGFCILRPRWSSLYAARKRRLDPTIGLPALPNTFFGWIPGLYRVTEEQVLASAGLDAFVFLSFFKLAIRLISVMLFFALTVLWPINYHFIRLPDLKKKKPHDGDSKSTSQYYSPYEMNGGSSLDGPYFTLGDKDKSFDYDESYLWAYLVFTYFFTALVVYFMNKETFRVIRIRQDYLGTQSTITDRTFRLSGLPSDLRSEDKIKALIEKLEIGDVESVQLCRDWKILDELIVHRAELLRKLEEAWSVYLGKQAIVPKYIRAGQRPVESESSSDRDGQASHPGQEVGENGPLLSHDAIRTDLIEGNRPSIRLRYGFLGLRSKRTDAIDYYEEKLRQLDEKIHEERDKSHASVDLAFVTMDSIAACQMAIQARIDPRPGQLLTTTAPSPSDVVWANTYAPRGVRRLRSWFITGFVSLLTLLWLPVVVFVAGLVTICTFSHVFPQAVKFLNQHAIAKALVETGLPTITVSLLNVAVPYLYDYLSYQQGMISKGDVELSIISKNFFFTFFNIFVVFTISSTTIQFLDILKTIQDAFLNTRKLAIILATKIQDQNMFYTSFIMLQGLGLFPFRLLEVGSVFLYPIYRMGAKTPRDFAQIMEPPIFSYGFYLPTALLVFILCLVYSILENGHLVLLTGLIYFVFGYFTYKYQLLYAMDQPQHATGGAWRIICYRIILGLLIFQFVMSAVMALKSAFVPSALTVPLLPLTFWYSYYFRRRFEPLTRFIALRSIRVEIDAEDAAALDENFEEPRPSQGLLRRGSTVDEDREKGLKFINPSLTIPLEQPWIYQDPPPIVTEGSEDGQASNHPVEPRASDSSLSLGDTHIWRNGDNNV